MDERIVRWIESFLSNRTTILKANEHTTSKIEISVGIPQGSSLSPILFLFYIAPLLKELRRRNVEACDFVNDTALMAQSNSARDSCELLTRIHEEVCMPWASTHGAKFAPNKYQLCHLTRKRQSPTDSMTINGSISVAPKETVKYLGVCLDSKLNGKAQVNSNKTKALKTVGALSCLAGFTWGARFTRTRQMMHAVFLPQLTHGCSAWYTPYGEKGHTKGVITSLSSVLYRAQRAITGAFKATSKAALQIETFSSPIHVHMDRIVCQAALRIATSPAYQAIIATRFKKRTRIISLLEKLTARLKRKTGTYIKDLEIITPFAALLW